MEIFLYIETSAKYSTNVNRALQIIVQNVLDYKEKSAIIKETENSTAQNSRSCYGSLISRLFNLFNLRSIIDALWNVNHTKHYNNLWELSLFTIRI